MSGHVFHPGHDALHGITVIVHTKTPRTFVGRWDAIENGFVILKGVSMHEEGQSPKSKTEWLSDTKTYGIAVQFPQLTVPEKDVQEVVKLVDYSV